MAIANPAVFHSGEHLSSKLVIPFLFILMSFPIFATLFFFLLTGQAPISSDWTVTPGKRVLEGLEEIEDAPTNDDVVVETDKAAHLDR